MFENTSKLLAALDRFYLELDRRLAPLYRIHAARLQCRPGCHQCCVDDLTVWQVEAHYIRLHHEALLRRETPHPAGGCAFLNSEGHCRIYPHRPYVCRTQGLPLRWIEEEPDGGWVEFRDICPLNEPGEAIEMLPEDQCWTIGPFEARLAKIQSEFMGGAGQRIALRSLFRVTRRD